MRGLRVQRAAGTGHAAELQAMSEVGLDRGPFAVEHAVDAGVAQRAVGLHQVLAQYPVQFGAQPLDGSTALAIEEMGTEFHCDAVELLEGVSQKQQLALGVQGAALHALSIPGGADLDAPIERVDVHVGGHADCGVRGLFDHGKGYHRALRLKTQATVTEMSHIRHLRFERPLDIRIDGSEGRGAVALQA